ncbi:hypothetical protein T484DRAFT_1772533 [Baffinella frigidus]|nr:hypothetical protein T484DRAFT_1772533 [Cryptophyta sp. CCMP2293]
MEIRVVPTDWQDKAAALMAEDADTDSKALKALLRESDRIAVRLDEVAALEEKIAEKEQEEEKEEKEEEKMLWV